MTDSEARVVREVVQDEAYNELRRLEPDSDHWQTARQIARAVDDRLRRYLKVGTR